MTQQTLFEPADYHHCAGHQEGDFIFFTCPLCKGWQR